ncbi:SidA/IucD/PvdA family monooxygenase [Mesorhizobium sp. L2C067A000]|uniref:SidA/IucD/PvdA family monooxygenase n=1 Tax=Mesorhizobium sp. L2C067A000 TaxID=1287106 RepID=UPI0003CFB9BD|nr:SidA/IucD/PvdA family monooxygenase [Mesorhizobium sp. L2C067A000]ESZ23740.1 hypothetical protein X733_32740 [Mesorhizobium sp. L2C067A000]
MSICSSRSAIGSKRPWHRVGQDDDVGRDLYENGRLYHFLNAQFEAVLRSEFEQYLNWAFHRNPLVVAA